MALSHYRAGDYHFGFAVRTRMDNVERIIPAAKTRKSKHNLIYHRDSSARVVDISLDESIAVIVIRK